MEVHYLCGEITLEIKARIIGVDLNQNAKKWEKYGFDIFIGDQSDPEFWSNFRKK